jgi:hypothetical protein
MKRRIVWVAAAAMLLAGCSSTPATEPAPDAGPSDEPVAITTDECLVDRTWNLDVQDLGGQVRAQLEDTGMPILNLVADGEMTLVFAGDGIANAVGDVTFVIAIQPDDAPASTLEQRQYGSGYGPWAWQAPDSDVVNFSGWESDWVIEAKMMVGGTSIEAPFDLPPSLTDGETMTVSCVGDTLTTTTDGNPFVRYWEASG